MPPAGGFPKHLPTDELLKIVEKIHSNSGDFVEGDLIDRLWRYDSYVLKLLPIQDLEDEWAIDDETVSEYAALSTQPPPIVYDPRSKSIIDGSHRIAALREKGQTEIWAYVGEKKLPIKR
jgi:hypothetical protein